MNFRLSWIHVLIFFLYLALGLLTFGYSIFIAKNLGVADYGIYQIGISFLFCLLILSEFISSHRIIYSSQDQKDEKLFLGLLMYRICILSVIFAVFAYLISRFDQDTLRVSVSLMAVMAVIPQGLSLLAEGVLIKQGRRILVATLFALSLLIQVLLGVVFIYLGAGAVGLLVALIAGNLFYFFGLAVLPVKGILSDYLKHGNKEKIILLSFVKNTTKLSLKLGLLGVFSLIYFKIDTLLLGYLRNSYEAGLYSLAYKFLESMVMLPLVGSIGYFTLTNLKIKSYSEYIANLRWFFVLAMTITFAYLLIVANFIKSVLPEFSEAVFITQLLAITVPFFVCSLPGVFLIERAKGLSSYLIALSILPLFVNLTLNFYFIPIMGYEGAAYITVLTSIVLFLISYFTVRYKVFPRSGIKL